jgi:non-canonical poly(A) RNA polymerase PAPD5/7
MQPSRTRLTCRAHNRFNPSLALWQHFVASTPSTLHQQQRPSSTATQASSSYDTGNGEPHHTHEISSPQQLETAAPDHDEQNKPSSIRARKMTTVKGRWFPSKAGTSIAKNMRQSQVTRQQSSNQSEVLLSHTKRAFQDSEDYEAVVVRPRLHPVPNEETSLPWSATVEERASQGPALDRYIKGPTHINMFILTKMFSDWLVK